MNELREKFEVWAYSKKWNIARVRDMGLDHYVDDFVNGAWYAFQEQQKKIDAVLKYIDDEKWVDEYGDYHCPVLKIQEILK